MTLETPARLALAVAVSAIIHTAVLLPVKAPKSLYTPTPFAASLLKVQLLRDSAPLPATTPDAATGVPVEAAPSESPAIPSSTLPPADPGAISPSPESATRERLAGNSTSAPTPIPEHKGQGRPGVRVALPDEVKVFVRRYNPKAEAEDNPTEVMDLPGGKYFYFNAPRLKRTAHPLGDAAPQYPSKKVDYPHGAVMLLLFIDQEGKLENTSVVCANPAFEESALASIRDMRFSPAWDANGPVKSYMVVEFSYGTGAPCGPLPHNLKLN